MRKPVSILLLLLAFLTAFAIQGHAVAPQGKTAAVPRADSQASTVGNPDGKGSEVIPQSLWPRDMLRWMAGLSGGTGGKAATQRPAEPAAERSAEPAAGPAEDAGNLPLARATLLSIAFLLALLTVIATWDVPPVRTLPSTPEASKETKDPAGKKPSDEKAAGGGSSVLPAIFQSNFAKTVLSGLGGMVVVSFIENSFWEKVGISAKPHYVVLFTIFFLTILLLSALYQGIVEALRSRVVLLGRHAVRNPAHERFFTYWGRRLWQWALSWRSAWLIFLDTVFNVVQGRNQLQTAGLGKAILNLHMSQVWTASRVRQEVDDAVLRALRKPEAQQRLRELGADPPENEDIRVNISVLSEDGLSVSYISWEEGSLGEPFGQRSIAWVAVCGGQARWYRHSKAGEAVPWAEAYQSSTTLFDNQDGKLPVKDRFLQLGEYYQTRKAPDYEGFLVLPLPWTERGSAQNRQKAGLHISFRDARYMDVLWEGLERDAKTPNYEEWRGLLDCHDPEGSPRESRPEEILEVFLEQAEDLVGTHAARREPPKHGCKLLIRDPELAAVLRESVDVLGELLRFFNPRIFEEQVLPQLKAA